MRFQVITSVRGHMCSDARSPSTNLRLKSFKAGGAALSCIYVKMVKPKAPQRNRGQSLRQQRASQFECVAVLYVIVCSLRIISIVDLILKLSACPSDNHTIIRNPFAAANTVRPPNTFSQYVCSSMLLLCAVSRLTVICRCLLIGGLSLLDMNGFG